MDFAAASGLAGESGSSFHVEQDQNNKIDDESKVESDEQIGEISHTLLLLELDEAKELVRSLTGDLLSSQAKLQAHEQQKQNKTRNNLNVGTSTDYPDLCDRSTSVLEVAIEVPIEQTDVSIETDVVVNEMAPIINVQTQTEQDVEMGELLKKYVELRKEFEGMKAENEQLEQDKNYLENDVNLLSDEVQRLQDEAAQPTSSRNTSMDMGSLSFTQYQYEQPQKTNGASQRSDILDLVPRNQRHPPKPAKERGDKFKRWQKIKDTQKMLNVESRTLTDSVTKVFESIESFSIQFGAIRRVSKEVDETLYSSLSNCAELMIAERESSLLSQIEGYKRELGKKDKQLDEATDKTVIEMKLRQMLKIQEAELSEARDTEALLRAQLDALRNRCYIAGLEVEDGTRIRMQGKNKITKGDSGHGKLTQRQSLAMVEEPFNQFRLTPEIQQMLTDIRVDNNMMENKLSNIKEDLSDIQDELRSLRSANNTSTQDLQTQCTKFVSRVCGLLKVYTGGSLPETTTSTGIIGMKRDIETTVGQASERLKQIRKQLSSENQLFRLNVIEMQRRMLADREGLVDTLLRKGNIGGAGKGDLLGKDVIIGMSFNLINGESEERRVPLSYAIQQTVQDADDLQTALKKQEEDIIRLREEATRLNRGYSQDILSLQKRYEKLENKFNLFMSNPRKYMKLKLESPDRGETAGDGTRDIVDKDISSEIQKEQSLSKRQLRRHSSQLQGLQQKLDALSGLMKEEKKRSLESERRQMEMAEQLQNSYEKETKRQIGLLEDRIGDLTKLLNETTEDLNAQRAKEREESMELLHKVLDEHRAEVQELRRKSIEDRTIANEQLQLSSVKFEKMQVELLAALEEVDRLKLRPERTAEDDERMRNLEESNIKLTEENKTLKEDVKGAKENIQLITIKLQSAQTQILELAETQERLQDRLAVLDDESHNEEQTFQNWKKKVEKDVETIKTKFSREFRAREEDTRKISDLENKLGKLEGLYDESQRKLRDVEGDRNKKVEIIDRLEGEQQVLKAQINSFKRARDAEMKAVSNVPRFEGGQ